MGTKEELVQLLRDVSTGEHELYHYGLCHIMSQKLRGLSQLYELLQDSMSSWYDDEGVLNNYPVSHPTLSNSKAYHLFRANGWQMNGRSPYGMERRRLAKHLADVLDNNTEELSTK